MSYALPKQLRASDISRAYIIWTGMVARCYVRSNTSYRGYGGRGIRVCKRWRDSFDAFIQDMDVPEKHESIDRINTIGHYKPSNCRWATALEQGRNRRDSLKLAYRGEIKTLKEWSEETGIKYHTLRWRQLRGWPSHKILEAA